MNIVIYGVSRSGKDYLINDLVKYLNEHSYECEHLKGSFILNELSSSIYGTPFSALPESDKELIRQRFALNVINHKTEEKIYFVDGHCSFFQDGKSDIYDVVTDNDLDAYDLYFYMDTEAEVIFSRLNSANLTASDINRLKNHEIDLLTSRLLAKNKELHVIDYYDSYVLEYILSVISGRYSSETIAKSLVQDVEDLDNTSVILLDCDKTLSLEDSTSIALKANGISEEELKRIYRDDRYTNYQAVRAKRFIEDNIVYDKTTVEVITENIHLNESLINDLKEKTNTVKLIAITASNPLIWKTILSQRGLDVIVLNSDYVVSKYVKYYVLKELQSRCKYVLSIGDSIIDSLMLSHANKAYLISNKGYREKVYQLLKQNKTIYQLSYNTYLYEGIRTDEHICEIKALEQSEYVKELIEVCRSTSGIEGYQLRNAHYKLGKEVGKMILDDNPGENFV